jgi:hypothetical protein
MFAALGGRLKCTNTEVMSWDLNNHVSDIMFLLETHAVLKNTCSSKKCLVGRMSLL